MTTEPTSQDHVASLIAQWRAARPDIPLDGMEILGRARRLTMLSRGAIDAVFARHGVDAGEFDVLATLRRAGRPFALRPTELFQTLMISSGGLTDRLRRLEARGLISREPSPTDKRSQLVKLTEQGLILVDRVFAEDMQVERTLLAPLNALERQTLAALLAKLLVASEQADASG